MNTCNTGKVIGVATRTLCYSLYAICIYYFWDNKYIISYTERCPVQIRHVFFCYTFLRGYIQYSCILESYYIARGEKKTSAVRTIITWYAWHEWFLSYDTWVGLLIRKGVIILPECVIRILHGAWTIHDRFTCNCAPHKSNTYTGESLHTFIFFISLSFTQEGGYKLYRVCRYSSTCRTLLVLIIVPFL